jgi:hypothetical protein
MNNRFRSTTGLMTLLSLGLVLGSSAMPTAATEHHGHQTPIAHGNGHPHHGTPHHDHPHGDSHEHQSHEGHHHGTMEIPMGQPVPTVALVIHPDAVRGWNLEIQTTYFRFAPEQVNQANQPNVGHGHLYINGERMARVYGNWLHLPQLPAGLTEITVSLNANGHEAFTYQGQPIQATVVVDVPE